MCSCGEIKKVDRSGMESEEANREIKVVKESDIVLKAQKIGLELVLKDFVDEASQKHFIDSLKNKNIQLRYLSLADSINNISKEELSLLQAYAYSLEHDLTLESNLQIIEKESILYTFPKMSGDSLESIISILFPRKEIVMAF